MNSTRIDALKAKALAAAPDQVVPGAVYRIDDSLLSLPAESGSRTTHDERYVVVLQSRTVSRNSKQKTVLVAPCSASCAPGPFDVTFDSENGFAQRNISVYLTLLQPVLRGCLKKHQGQLTSEGKHTLQMGMVSILVGGEI